MTIQQSKGTPGGEATDFQHQKLLLVIKADVLLQNGVNLEVYFKIYIFLPNALGCRF